MLLLGYDVGSSAIKAALVDAETGQGVAAATSPAGEELRMAAPKPGWAEQDPDDWWAHIVRATEKLRAESPFEAERVAAIGVAYQMHGLVVVGEDERPLRPAIIWCDGRAAEIGARAFRRIGPARCLRRYLNSPGNFTAAKLAWVKEHEPDVYDHLHKAMLPGDYIGLRMTGEIATTPPGLSEAVLWDMREDRRADELLDHFGLDGALLPQTVPTFSVQGELTRAAAEALGLRPGTSLAYRAGDQPNNAFALGALDPGTLAASAGTSGVVYGVTDRPVCDEASRVNTFLHVGHDAPEAPRYGVLLCVNGAGSLQRWLRQTLSGYLGGDALSYDAMNAEAVEAPAGAEGLCVLPFGNGAERTLEDVDLGASVRGLRFNRHGRAHLLRAAQEGVAFALARGVEIMRQMGLSVDMLRAAATGLFQSTLFGTALATTADTEIRLFDTDGAEGAARGAGVGAGIYASATEAARTLTPVRTLAPDTDAQTAYRDAFTAWTRHLNQALQDHESAHVSA